MDVIGKCVKACFFIKIRRIADVCLMSTPMVCKPILCLLTYLKPKPLQGVDNFFIFCLILEMVSMAGMALGLFISVPFAPQLFV